MSILSFFKKKKEENLETQPVQQRQDIYLSEQLKQITDSIANFSKFMRNLEARTQEITEKISAIEEKIGIHEQDINNIKSSVEKMFVLYDWLIKQYNPFIEEEKITKEEKTTENKIETTLESSKYLPLDEIREDPAFIAIIMGWLNYLVTKSNIEETIKALEYYCNIGWITEDVKIKLEKYLEGYINIECRNEKITPEDHLVSLYIITKLKAGIEEGIIRFKDLYMELVNKGIIRPIR